MSEIPYVEVNTWQDGREVRPDQPVMLVWVNNTLRHCYMRYHGEFHRIDNYSFRPTYRWRISGVRFNYASITWMHDNAIAYPFTREDRVLYLLTWGDVRD